jgi:hypothetical protein
MSEIAAGTKLKYESLMPWSSAGATVAHFGKGVASIRVANPLALGLGVVQDPGPPVLLQSLFANRAEVRRDLLFELAEN